MQLDTVHTMNCGLHFITIAEVLSSELRSWVF